MTSEERKSIFRIQEEEDLRILNSLDPGRCARILGLDPETLTKEELRACDAVIDVMER